MRKFDQLSEIEKESAIQRCYGDYLIGVSYQGLAFDDSKNNNEIQYRIDIAIDLAIAHKAEMMVHKYIEEDEIIKNHLINVAIETATEAWYPDPHEIIVDIYRDTIPCPPPSMFN